MVNTYQSGLAQTPEFLRQLSKAYLEFSIDNGLPSCEQRGFSMDSRHALLQAF
jgi:hypothetical protein